MKKILGLILTLALCLPVWPQAEPKSAPSPQMNTPSDPGVKTGLTVNQETIIWGQQRNNMARAGIKEQDKKINSAIYDWLAVKPLPNLPDLRQPVRIKVGSYVCNTAGELLNPNVEIVTSMQECIITAHTMLVSVLQPTNQKDFISDYYHEIVQVSSRSAAISDGNTYTGWVPIACLGNGIKPH
jgi:hypothetical protein